MLSRRTAAAIAAAWQTEIERGLEVGARPLWTSGAADDLLPSAGTLLALQQMLADRADLTTPLVVAGGNSALWLGLLLSPRPTAQGRHAPLPVVRFAGADAATHLAALACLAAPTAATDPAPALTLPLAPQQHPGAAAPWESLPLGICGDPAPMPLVAGGGRAPADSLADWIAWAAMILAGALILAALIL